MEKPESKKIYSLRKITVEPVYGNLKENLGFRGFLLRGLEKVKIELNLVCIAHNLQKIWKLSREKQEILTKKRENKGVQQRIYDIIVGLVQNLCYV